MPFIETRSYSFYLAIISFHGTDWIQLPSSSTWSEPRAPPPHHQNTPSLPESVTGWSTFCEQMDCNPLQHPPPPPKHSQEQPPRHYANATDWNAHHGQFNPNPQQQPQQSYYPYPLMQHLPSRLPMNAAGYNKNCVVDGNDNTISIGGNQVSLNTFPSVVLC